MTTKRKAPKVRAMLDFELSEADKQTLNRVWEDTLLHGKGYVWAKGSGEGVELKHVPLNKVRKTLKMVAPKEGKKR